MKFLLNILVGFVVPAISVAQNSVADPVPEEPSFFWIVVQAFVALLLVIGGIVLVVWVLKQLMNRTQNRPAGGQNGNFTVVQQCNLSPVHTLYAVRFLDDLFVVAGTEDGLSAIHRYADFTRWDEIKADPSHVTQNFGQLFRNSLQGKFTGQSREKS